MNAGEVREQQLGEQAQREEYGRSFHVAPQRVYLVILCLAPQRVYLVILCLAPQRVYLVILCLAPQRVYLVILCLAPQRVYLVILCLAPQRVYLVILCLAPQRVYLVILCLALSRPHLPDMSRKGTDLASFTKTWPLIIMQILHADVILSHVYTHAGFHTLV